MIDPTLLFFIWFYLVALPLMGLIIIASMIIQFETKAYNSRKRIKQIAVGKE